MAKIGIEVEGRLRGVRTLFVDVDEMARSGGVDLAIRSLKTWRLTHVYISDRFNVLNYAEVGEWFQGFLVTLDVTEVSKQKRPTNVTLILTMPHSHWESVSNLTPQDQVKFHSADRHVLCASAHAFVPTHPDEFAGDIDLNTGS